MAPPICFLTVLPAEINIATGFDPVNNFANIPNTTAPVASFADGIVTSFQYGCAAAEACASHLLSMASVLLKGEFPLLGAQRDCPGRSGPLPARHGPLALPPPPPAGPAEPHSGLPRILSGVDGDVPTDTAKGENPHGWPPPPPPGRDLQELAPGGAAPGPAN